MYNVAIPIMMREHWMGVSVGMKVEMNRPTPFTRYASMPIVKTIPARAASILANFPAAPLPNRYACHCAPVIQLERLCHFPVQAITNIRPSGTPPRNSINNPLGPSRYSSEAISIVPVISSDQPIPEMPNCPPRKAFASKEIVVH